MRRDACRPSEPRPRRGELPGELEAAALRLVLMAAVAAPVVFPDIAHRLFGIAPTDPAFEPWYRRALQRLLAHLAADPSDGGATDEAPGPDRLTSPPGPAGRMRTSARTSPAPSGWRDVRPDHPSPFPVLHRFRCYPGPVESRNVTVSLPRDLLRRVKVVAAKRDTSISALLVAAVEDIVRDDDLDDARRRLVVRSRTGYDLGGLDAATRDELHDRSR